MEPKNKRIELLKWVSARVKRISTLQKTLEKINEEIWDFPELQDLNLNRACSELMNLADRMEYMNKKIDAQMFVNEGKMQFIEKGSEMR